MPNDAPMSAEHHVARYHDDHLDDPAEWDESSAQDVAPRPSGMTVFSLRITPDEFRLLKREAERRQVSMSELTRTALRFYLAPRASGTLSATSLYRLQIYSHVPVWTGGVADSAQVKSDMRSLAGNVLAT